MWDGGIDHAKEFIMYFFLVEEDFICNVDYFEHNRCLILDFYLWCFNLIKLINSLILLCCTYICIWHKLELFHLQFLKVLLQYLFQTKRVIWEIVVMYHQFHLQKLRTFLYFLLIILDVEQVDEILLDISEIPPYFSFIRYIYRIFKQL